MAIPGHNVMQTATAQTGKKERSALKNMGYFYGAFWILHSRNKKGKRPSRTGGTNTSQERWAAKEETKEKRQGGLGTSSLSVFDTSPG